MLLKKEFTMQGVLNTSDAGHKVSYTYLPVFYFFLFFIFTY